LVSEVREPLVSLKNTIWNLPGLVKEGDLRSGGYGGGREKQTSRERLIKIVGPFLNL
jgi:hypothetical protein